MALPRALAQPRPRPRLIIIGNGMAAIRLVEEILNLNDRAFEITIFGAEPLGHYNRIQLSQVLAGDKDFADLITHPLNWYAERAITFHAGDAVTTIDPESRTVTAASGRVERWDHLILATGASPILPPIPGIGLSKVVGFRDHQDVDTMLKAAHPGRPAVVIGGGVLGLEAAWGLKAQGMDVTLIHMMPCLMERQLDPTGALLLRQGLEAQGIRCLTETTATAILGEHSVHAVRIQDGTIIPADLVVLAAGIRPRTDLARTAGLDVGAGIRVGADLSTSHPGIWAVGECVEFDGQTFGLVKPLYDMAEILARHLTGHPAPAFAIPPQSTTLKVPPLPLFTAGNICASHADDREIVHHDQAGRIYRKIILRRGKVVGAVLVGDTSQSGELFQWMKECRDLGESHCRLFCQGCGTNQDDLAAMPDDHIVCHCNQVSKGAILSAIQDQGLRSLAQVTAVTRAGMTCGQCSVVVARILAQATGERPPDLAAQAHNAKIRHQAFTLWHRTHASLMTVLLFTGLGLHFPQGPFNWVGFDWSRRLHEWGGLAVIAAFCGFLWLNRRFERRWAPGLDRMAMFILMPALCVSGLLFLWPQVMPRQMADFTSVLWSALAHLGLATTSVLYLIHHLGEAPFRWWRKRRSARPAGNRDGICFTRLFLRKGYANENQ